MNDQKNLNHAPGYGLDPLSEVMQLLKLNVSIYHNAKVCGGWQLDDAGTHSVSFHVVTLGRCFLEATGHFSGELHEGDLVLFTRALPHTLRPMTSQSGKQQHLSFNDGELLTGTGLLCGDISFQHKGSSHLLDALPPLLLVRFDQAKAWLQPLLQMIVTENRALGPVSKVIFDRLSELLVTYAVRHYIMEQSKRLNCENSASMLALYGDERLALAVSEIHQKPAQEWSLEQLAKKAMMSRTVFAERFKLLSGWTAGQYITWWRMQLAWQQLQNGAGVANVADNVGYKSEAAFSRAFKKMFEVSPGRVRRGVE
ncbi:MAG: AraC family transcriptional regulator [Gammaproteobacteria bacterium]|nr:AraC family transcriptional regulator [Gammaproteobacteria bacterium]